MNKFYLITKREFLVKVKNKSFIIITFLMPFLIVGMSFLIYYLSNINSSGKTTVAIVGENEFVLPTLFESNDEVQFQNVSALGLDEAIKRIAEDNFNALLFLPKTDNISDLKSNLLLYCKDVPDNSILTLIEDRVATAIKSDYLIRNQIDIEIINNADVTVDLGIKNLSGDDTSKYVRLVKLFVGFLLGYFVMMFIIVYGNSVMRSIIEEKSNRIIEVIISSVQPFQLMLGKITGNALAGMLQYIVWVSIVGISGLIGSTIFGINQLNQLENLPVKDKYYADLSPKVQLLLEGLYDLPFMEIMFFFLLFFIGGYFLYAAIYAAIGSAVDSETDTQQFMFPVVIPLVLGVYVGFTAISGDPHGPVALIFSLIPLTSPIVMLMRIPFGVPIWQILLSISLLFASFFGILFVASKIYKVGILMYGKKHTYKDLFKWLKYK